MSEYILLENLKSMIIYSFELVSGNISFVEIDDTQSFHQSLQTYSMPA